jgi:membrane-associated phospholipid phosphatase
MGFAAVYLDHHWIVDVMLGATYCLGSIAVVRFADARLHPASGEAAPALEARLEG